MNAYLNNTGKVFAIIRNAGSLPLLDLVARCNLAPNELLGALKELSEDKLIEVQSTEGKFLDAAAEVIAEVSKSPSRAPDALRANLVFALNEKYRSLGRVPVAAL